MSTQFLLVMEKLFVDILLAPYTIGRAIFLFCFDRPVSVATPIRVKREEPPQEIPEVTPDPHFEIADFVHSFIQGNTTHYLRHYLLADKVVVISRTGQSSIKQEFTAAIAKKQNLTVGFDGATEWLLRTQPAGDMRREAPLPQVAEIEDPLDDGEMNSMHYEGENNLKPRYTITGEITSIGNWQGTDEKTGREYKSFHIRILTSTGKEELRVGKELRAEARKLNLRVGHQIRLQFFGKTHFTQLQNGKEVEMSKNHYKITFQ